MILTRVALVVFTCVLVLALSVFPAAAQTTVVGQQAIGWDQSATNLAEANSLSYTIYIDAAAAGAALTGVTCTGSASPFACQANLPPLTPGTHALALTASLQGQESAKSTPLSVTMVVVSVPQNLRIVAP